MSEPKTLIPNINEIIVEYVEGENEAVQATQTETGEEQVRAEAQEENKTHLRKEESRKELSKMKD